MATSCNHRTRPHPLPDRRLSPVSRAYLELTWGLARQVASRAGRQGSPAGARSWRAHHARPPHPGPVSASRSAPDRPERGAARPWTRSSLARRYTGAAPEWTPGRRRCTSRWRRSRRALPAAARGHLEVTACNSAPDGLRSYGQDRGAVSRWRPRREVAGRREALLASCCRCPLQFFTLAHSVPRARGRGLRRRGRPDHARPHRAGAPAEPGHAAADGLTAAPPLLACPRFRS